MSKEDQKMKRNKLYHYDWTEWWKKRNPLGWRLYSWLIAESCAKTIQRLKIKNILELGGGSGLVAKRLAQKFKVKATLLDNNQAAYQAFLKFSNEGEYLKKDFFSFKTRRRWNLVFSLGVLEHFPKKKRLKLIKIHQKLSSKYVFIAIPVNSWLRRGYSLLRYFSIEKYGGEKELKNEFKEAGLKPWRSGENLWWAWVLSRV